MTPLMHVWNIFAGLGWYALIASRGRHTADKRQDGIVGAFVIAGLIAIPLTYVLHAFYPDVIEHEILGPRWWTFDVFVTGLVEETAKFTAFLFAVRSGATIREPEDGALFGAIVGATFGMIENVGYIMTFGNWVMWIRPLLTTGGHAMYGAIWGGLYAQAIYASRVGTDRRSESRALIGIPLAALIHGTYNAFTFFVPFALLVKAAGLVIAVALYRNLVELSPYRVFPLAMARTAVARIRAGLSFNPKSPVLNRNLGIYLMHLGRYRAASEHLRASVPRSRDPRRAQFLASACETTFLPNYFAYRAFRIAWARLTDDQRVGYLRQLSQLVGDRDGIVARVHEYVARAFAPRRFRNTREIAYEHKLRRIRRKHRRVSDLAADGMTEMSESDRARLARRMRGGG